MMTGMGSGDEKMVGWTDLASSPFRRTAKCPHCVSVEFSLGDFKVSRGGVGGRGSRDARTSGSHLTAIDVNLGQR